MADRVDPRAITSARESVGMTQTQAASLIGVTLRHWQRYESGMSVMSPILWQVWRIRAGLDAPESIFDK